VTGTATVPTAQAPQDTPATERTVFSRLTMLIGLLVLLAALTMLSFFVGSGDISASDTWNALFHPTGTLNDQLIRTERVPRTFMAIVVGAALGVAGALMQAVTLNPLADPGILGVNAGAYFFMALGIVAFGVTSTTGNIALAMLGALIAATAVYLIGATGRRGAGPAKLILAGVALSSVFNGVAQGMTLVDPKAFDAIRQWQVGSLQGASTEVLGQILPFVVAGLLVGLLLVASLNVLALGDDRARALGARVGLIRGTGFASVTILCGAGTAAVGPITFLGLMVPHTVRMIVGPDQRWVVPGSLVASDMIGRVLTPSEVPVGLVTAFIGAPVLIYLVRRKGDRSL
jgi:ABC-type Fe3+-siderophore transport system permease subunit